MVSVLVPVSRYLRGIPRKINYKQEVEVNSFLPPLLLVVLFYYHSGNSETVLFVKVSEKIQKNKTQPRHPSTQALRPAQRYAKVEASVDFHSTYCPTGRTLNRDGTSASQTVMCGFNQRLG